MSNENHLVDYRYFMAKTGLSIKTTAKHILFSRLTKANKTGGVSQYKKIEVDDLIVEYNRRFEPMKLNELKMHQLAEHFKRSPDYIAKVVRHKDFPAYDRLYQERGSRKPFRVWLLDDVEGLKIEAFYSVAKEIEPEPFSWSGIQAEFIRMCRPGGLLVNNGDFA
jgi:hypothetical protein